MPLHARAVEACKTHRAMKRKASYYVIFPLWYVFSLLPLRLLYLVSDLLYVPVYKIFGYRRRVVRKNLEESFPDKSRDELREIERKFYRYFCDYLVETIKYFSISEREIRRRMVFEGAEEANRYLAEGKSSILFMGHYCNWEWVSSLPLYITKADDHVRGHIYHRLANATMDALFLRMRHRFESENIEMHSALRVLARCRAENKKFVIGFISDQAPKWENINMWTDFLNHKTAFFTGAESLAKLADAAVFYIDVKRVRRGYYHARFVKMTDRPKDFTGHELTEWYAQLLQQSIEAAPEFWLWTHNRWKRTYEEYVLHHAKKRDGRTAQ